ncbi:type VI secretion system tube protein TssD [Pedobacter sp. UYP1]|uniref:type VI secretion system tube protein TssD n=1 Tax=Pedobacter sp. UYP1 TaxID=1756396 RepID=UPI00339530AC
MNVKAILSVGIEKYELVHLDFSVEQAVDDKMQPQHEVYGGFFELEIAQQINALTYKWMVNNFEQRDGKIDFKDEGGQTMHTIHFTKGYCVNYRQQVSATGNQSLTTWLTISAGKVMFNNIELDNNWVKN